MTRSPLRTLCLLGTLAMVASGSGCAGMKSVVAKFDKKPEKPRQESLRQLKEQDRAEACRLAGLEFAKAGKHDQAIKQLIKAREMDRSLPGVSRILAVMYDQSGQFTQAEREYKLALKETPHDADLISDYGFFQYEQGDLEGAKKTLSAALKKVPDHRLATINLALVLAESREYDKAEALFRQAVGEAAAAHNVGMVMLRHEEFEKAREKFESARRHDAGLALPASVLAWMDSRPEIETVNFEQPQAE